VTGGNVSFYNESPTASVFPTPVIGMLGVIDDVRKALTVAFKKPGDRIYLLGQPLASHLGGSEYLAVIHGKVAGDAPEVDLGREHRLQRLLVRLAQEQIARSAHDCAEGGLAVAIAECCISARSSQLGARVKLPSDGRRPDVLMFAEDQARVLVTADPAMSTSLEKAAQELEIELTALGEVTSNAALEFVGLGKVDLAALDDAYYGVIAGIMKRD
jgi:phosphoribosylformylglycinamidine synthase subunit PurL